MSNWIFQLQQSNPTWTLSYLNIQANHTTTVLGSATSAHSV